MTESDLLPSNSAPWSPVCTSHPQRVVGVIPTSRATQKVAMKCRIQHQCFPPSTKRPEMAFAEKEEKTKNLRAGGTLAASLASRVGCRRCRFRPVIFQRWPCRFAPWTTSHSPKSSATRTEGLEKTATGWVVDSGEVATYRTDQRGPVFDG